MRQIITEKLKEIEKKENVKILYAIEAGSRAWGFASPDSDFDVRFVYVKDVDFYLRLDKTRDVIEWQLDETLDINGWDLKKTLQLLRSSNPTVFEWNGSPIVYKSSDEWSKIAVAINDYFQIKPSLYHYLSTAKNNLREYLQGDEVKYKKYFYAVRPILACKWILKNGTPPPVPFKVLYDNCLEEYMKPCVDRLLAVKIGAYEAEAGKRIDALNQYIEESITSLDESIKALPKAVDPDWSGLNDLFVDILKNGR